MKFYVTTTTTANHANFPCNVIDEKCLLDEMKICLFGLQIYFEGIIYKLYDLLIANCKVFPHCKTTQKGVLLVRLLQIVINISQFSNLLSQATLLYWCKELFC